MLGNKGSEKAKRWAKNQTEKGIDVNADMIKGTDGKFYKYALEEFAKKRTKPPKSFKNK